VSHAPGGPTDASALSGRDGRIAAGVFLVVLAAYLLSGPGRIDIIDGQFRFDVTRSLLDGAGVRVRDPALPVFTLGVDGQRYAFYGPGASLTGAPLVALSRWIGGDRNTEMFFFSLTSAWVVSAAIASFYLFRRRLGGTPENSLLWTLFLAFGTPLWPLATTVFDQGQQATFLFLGVFLAWEAALRRSTSLAAVAGCVAGSVVLFQEGLCLLLPFAGLAVLEGAKRASAVQLRASDLLRIPELRTRYLPFALGCALPFTLWLLYNHVRFGNPLDSGKAQIPGHPPLWGDPVQGLLGLLFSPGKSMFLFFPSAALGALSLRSWFRQRPMLAASIGTIGLVQLLFNSSLTFWSSDWAWGPRYLMLLAPLLTLPLGIEPWKSNWHRYAARGIVALGLVVQLFGISVEHHRFFYERKLPAFFWYLTPELYWRESQWWSRPGELLSVLTEPLPEPPVAFRPGPYAASLPTYCIFGSYPPSSDRWMRQFAVFYLPRPWPFWIPALPPSLQPVDPVRASTFCGGLGCLGALLLLLGLRQREAPERAQPR
jgi:hypothetical protein